VNGIALITRGKFRAGHDERSAAAYERPLKQTQIHGISPEQGPDDRPSAGEDAAPLPAAPSAVWLAGPSGESTGVQRGLAVGAAFAEDFSKLSPEEIERRRKLLYNQRRRRPREGSEPAWKPRRDRIERPTHLLPSARPAVQAGSLVDQDASHGRQVLTQPTVALTVSCSANQAPYRMAARTCSDVRSYSAQISGTPTPPASWPSTLRATGTRVPAMTGFPNATLGSAVTPGTISMAVDEAYPVLSGWPACRTGLPPSG
jgi:hypothetical protein